MYIQTQYFIEQFYMELGEFEDILETLFLEQANVTFVYINFDK